MAVRDLLDYGTTPADQVRRLLPRSAVRVAVRGLLEALGHPQHAVLAQGGRAVVGSCTAHPRYPGPIEPSHYLYMFSLQVSAAWAVQHQAAPRAQEQSRPRNDALGVRTANARPHIPNAGILHDRLPGVRTPLPHVDVGVSFQV